MKFDFIFDGKPLNALNMIDKRMVDFSLEGFRGSLLQGKNPSFVLHLILSVVKTIGAMLAVPGWGARHQADGQQSVKGPLVEKLGEIFRIELQGTQSSKSLLYVY